MKKISLNQWPEIVIGSSESKVSQSIRRAVQKGTLRKLAPRLYTSNLTDPLERIIRKNLFHILSENYPNAVLSHRTALEGGLSREGIITLTYKYTKNITLPGVTIRLIKGEGKQEGDMPFMDKLFIASRERALLENLQSSRDRGAKTKILPKIFIEEYLDKLCQNYGVEELNQIRDKAESLSKKLHLENEFKKLDKLIGALQGTRDSKILKTQPDIARAEQIPYDTKRMEVFAKLFLALKSNPFLSSKIVSLNPQELNNLSFFEAYFSNFIEGTEFEVNEAADIIFRNKPMPYRPEDAHDILGTFKIVSDLSEMQRTPQSAEELLELLKARHAILLAGRRDKQPGYFKQLVNRAGNTIFVQPELVKGTLIKGFEIYKSLTPGIARAIYIMFLISEVHPFLDGNGRIARVMMNAELTSQSESRIIIPTVYREDYLLALRRLSREWDPDAYIKMLQRAQAFTNSINYAEYQIALSELTESNAFLEPSEGKLRFR